MESFGSGMKISGIETKEKCLQDISCQQIYSLRSRRKRGRGRRARAREKNGVLGARDEGTPATVFSSPPTNFQVIQLG